MSFERRLQALVAAALSDPAPRAGDVVELSRLFGAERKHRQADYMAVPRLRRAYLGFFVPQYAAKIALLLAQHEREGLFKLPPAPRVLDVGAGPLTGILGAWLARGALGPSVALDLATKAMSAGRSLLETVAPGQPVTLVEAPAQRRPLPAGPFDLIVVAHVLNEIGDPRRGLEVRVQLVRNLFSVLAPGGRILIVEPATRVHGRSLMSVRDEIAPEVTVLSPCRDAPSCPLLNTPGDWCHGELAWERPPAFQALERAAGLPKTVLKHSHLLLAKSDDEPPRGHGFRLVGGLMTDGRGVQRRYGCGPEGLVVLRGRPALAEDAARPLRHGLLDRPLLDDETEPLPAVRPSAGPGARTSSGRAGPSRAGRGGGRRRR